LTHIKDLKAQTQPLYRAIGFASVGATLAVTLFATYVGFRKRSWEIGLLLSQGWRWLSVFYLYFTYFAIIALLSGVISILLSNFLSGYVSFSYEVYGDTLFVNPSLSGVHMLSAIPVALSIGFLSVYLLVWRSRKLGVEGILRKY
ncbi:MAG: FtsX-like permease family protein, partial [Candidatus Geothermarchaeales archaeon]